MANKTLNSRIQLRNDTAANWTANNPVLLKGEIGIEIDSTPVKFKVGDGIKAWTQLNYFNIDTADFVTLTYLASTLADYAKLADLPTKTSDLTNDSDFINSTDLNNAIAAIGAVFTLKGSKSTVDELPTTGNSNGDVYLVDGAEYVWINDSKWELLGTTATVDLTNYYTKAESDNRYYQKTDDTVLTTNDTLVFNCGNA